jgi:hypothetical protein
MRSRHAWAAGLLLAAVGACSILPPDSPEAVVRGAIDRIVVHDLAGGSVLVCGERRNPRDFPVTIAGIFEPVGALSGFDIPRTLALIDLDVSRVTVTETSRNGDRAEVELGGSLVERFDPAEVEALFRAYAAESGQAVEEDLLRETMGNVSAGPVGLPVRETVPLIRENGAWRICPPEATP